MNIIKLDITNGLTNHKIGNGEYIKLLSAPAAANVTVKPHNSLNAGIPLKVGYELRARDDIPYSFVSCDAIAGEYIELMHSDNNDPYILSTTPSSVAVDALGSLEAQAIIDFDKIVNPYNYPVLSTYSTASITQIVALDKLLTCDKIKITFSLPRIASPNTSFIQILIGGVIVANQLQKYNTESIFIGSNQIVLEDIKNKQLKIVLQCSNVAYEVSASVEEYTLKA